MRTMTILFLFLSVVGCESLGQHFVWNPYPPGDSHRTGRVESMRRHVDRNACVVFGVALIALALILGAYVVP